MINFIIRIDGVGPLLMHNGQLSDPLHPASKALKAVTGKRTKTDEDHEELSRIEHLGGLYIDPDVGPYLPADNIWKTLHDAAKKTKQGKALQEGVVITTALNPLAYSGPRDAEGLWQDKNFVFRCTVKNQMSRVARTRPIFQSWATEASGILDEAAINFVDLQAIANTAGQLVGLGDWRPRYGRFTAKVTKA